MTDEKLATARDLVISAELKGIKSELSEKEKKNRRKSGFGDPRVGVGIDRTAGPPEHGTVGKISYNILYAASRHEHVEYDHPLGGQARKRRFTS